MLVKSTLMPGAMRFREADEVFGTLAAITDGWALAPATAGSEAQIEVAGDGRGFVIAEQGREPIREATAASAACTLVMIVLNRLVEKNPDWLCLHAGSVRIGGKTVVFPSTHRAGKSTLVTALALRRRRLVADDILPIDCTNGVGVAVASGVLPRLRLPLAAALGLRFRIGTRLRRTADDGHYRYVRPPRGSLAPFGERYEPDAFVFLERASGRPAELKAVTGIAAMRMLLMQNFGVAAPPDIVVGRIGRIAEQTPAFLLRYDRLPAAVQLLEATFAGARCAGSIWQTLEMAEPEMPTAADRPDGTPGSTVPPDRRIVRRRGITLIEKDGASFLVDREGGGIFGLDPLGAVIWQLLEEPTSAGEIAETIGDAYPDVDAQRIAEDVARLAETLVGNGLAAAAREG